MNIGSDNLPDTGLLIFKLISGDFARSNLHLEVVMDDMAFPSYTFSKATAKHTEFGESNLLLSLKHI